MDTIGYCPLQVLMKSISLATKPRVLASIYAVISGGFAEISGSQEKVISISNVLPLAQVEMVITGLLKKSFCYHRLLAGTSSHSFLLICFFMYTLYLSFFY